MSKPRVLITCPPMLQSMHFFRTEIEECGISVQCPDVIQALSEEELISMIPTFDAWIIGDDPANERVFAAGANGRLKVAVRWGVGTDNVDFTAASRLGIKVRNTPGVFGKEVADVATGYVIALARSTFQLDRSTRSGVWKKIQGRSLQGATAAVVGLGDIGCELARRLTAFGIRVNGYDPFVTDTSSLPSNVGLRKWPECLDEADYLILCCSLTQANKHLINESIFNLLKPGVRLINVARGGLIDETSLVAALDTGVVHSAALDVFEQEPLPRESELRRFENVVFGAHNGSNTEEAVLRTSRIAISYLLEGLGIESPLVVQQDSNSIFSQR